MINLDPKANKQRLAWVTMMMERLDSAIYRLSKPAKLQLRDALVDTYTRGRIDQMAHQLDAEPIDAWPEGGGMEEIKRGTSSIPPVPGDPPSSHQSGTA